VVQIDVRSTVEAVMLRPRSRGIQVIVDITEAALRSVFDELLHMKWSTDEVKSNVSPGCGGISHVFLSLTTDQVEHLNVGLCKLHSGVDVVGGKVLEDIFNA